MKFKKSNVTQIFVYAVSLIIVVFILFLANKFTFLFEKEAIARADITLFEVLGEDYKSTNRVYLSEQVYLYKVSKNLENICFVGNVSSCDFLGLNLTNNLGNKIKNISSFDGSNVFALNENNIFLKKNIGEFITKTNCFCIEPKLRKFSLKFTNKKNKVIIEEHIK